MTIIAAADGSALGNPGPSGWAWYVDDENWQAGGWPHGTNNQGEIMAVVALLRATAHVSDDLRVLCDSQYVINSVTKWMPGWKKRGWRKADGSPVLNRDLLTQLDDELQGRTVTFEWVRGHAGHELNEAADARARAAATAYQSGSPVPLGPGWASANGTAAQSIEPELFAIEAIVDVEKESFEGTLTLPSEISEVVSHERSLLDPAVRSNIERVEELLHPQFFEIGRSGREWSRDEVIDALGREYGSTADFDLLSAELLTDDVALLTFRTAHDDHATLRSSLWLREDGRWRVRFHQGTPES